MAYTKKEPLEAENVTTVADPMMFVDSDCEGPWNGHAFVCVDCQESFEFGVQMLDHNAAMHAHDEPDSPRQDNTYFRAFQQTVNNKESSEEPMLAGVKLEFHLPCAFCSHASENRSSLDRHLRYAHSDQHLLDSPRGLGRGSRGTARKRLRRSAVLRQPLSDLLQYWCEECGEVWESALGLQRHNWLKHGAGTARGTARGKEQGDGTH